MNTFGSFTCVERQYNKGVQDQSDYTNSTIPQVYCQQLWYNLDNQCL